jgi:uncharacterized protein YggE
MDRTIGSMVAVALILVMISGSAVAYALNSQPSGEGDRSMITVTGTAKTSLDPDRVEIYLGVETTDKEADVAQQENADAIEQIRDALLTMGISEEKITTNYYNLYPVRTWIKPLPVGVYDEGKEQITEYRATHILKVELDRTSLAGKVIDLAVRNGANKVQNVVFSVGDGKLAEAREGLLSKATKEAKSKAETIAGALEVQIKGVGFVSEGYYNYYPYRYDYPMYEANTVGASTEITPGQVEISVQVSAGFLI